MGATNSELPRNFDKELEESLKAGKGPAIIQFMIATIAGAASTAGRALATHYGGLAAGDTGEVVGGFTGGAIGGAFSQYSEEKQKRISEIFWCWLKLQEDEINEIEKTMFEILQKLDLQSEETLKRIQSPEYLSLLKKCFRDWSAAESEEKRRLIRNLLTNAAGANITTDDVISMFLSWIDRYSETHFKVIAAIYNNRGISRYQVWQNVDGRQVADNSAEADLFKFIFHELTTGYVIRQHREVNYAGQFVKQPARSATRNNSVYTSPFEDGKRYELTELGQQFVHYTMNEIVSRIASGESS